LIRSPFKVLLAALACTWIFYFEYLPPVRWVHIPFDLDGYHYPLADYAFQQVKHFRLPQWDPLTYSGMSFISNVQAAVFYPGTWIMFLAKWGHDRLSYLAMQELTLAHVALAFTLCYFWLAGKKLHTMAALLGAAVFAYSGYMSLQIQHFGLTVAYTWMPLGFLGIDQAARKQSWKPLWIVAVASAMAFLGGYPPNWLVFAVAAGLYALASPGRWRTVPGTVGAFAFSLLLCAVQVLPSWDATHFRAPEPHYAVGATEPLYYMAYIGPNFFDFGLNRDVLLNLGKQNFYLGSPGLFGLAYLWWRRDWRPIAPALAVTAVALFFAVSAWPIPFITNTPLLADLVRPYYYFAGVAIGLAELSAHGLHRFLSRESAPFPRNVFPAVLLPMVAWAVYELVAWRTYAFAHSWASLATLAVTMSIFTLGFFAYRTLGGRQRTWMAVVLVIFVGVDYKVFNTSTRLNGSAGEGPVFSDEWFGAMHPDAYRTIASFPDYRVLLVPDAPPWSVARHVGWKLPQGSDPMLTLAYRQMSQRVGTWNGDRGFHFDPRRPEVMQLLGIRFVTAGLNDELFPALKQDSRFRVLGPPDDGQYYKVFEFQDAKSIYQFVGPVDVQKRDPEHRVLRVNSAEGGQLTWAENGYPGWSAKLDGAPLRIETWESAFQAVEVPAGEHTVEFLYQERLLGLGAAISLVSLLLLAAWIWASSRSIYSTASPAASE
jgi:hypothetical protein